MIDDIRQTRHDIESMLSGITTREQLEEFRLRHLVQKGTLKSLRDRLREVPKEDKPVVGKELNTLVSFAEAEYERLLEQFTAAVSDTKTV
ncbi:MAG: hypothetical protein ACKOAX_05035, partial [Candidatus Kapaibacterium sp.]